jgi:hypothetical protein
MMNRTGPLIAFCLIGSLLAADDTETTARQTRLVAMRQRAEALKLKVSGKPELRRVEKEPLFRYSDATRTTTDGTLWLWTEAGRPLAAACLFNDTREGFQWNYECVSLSDSALFLDGRPGWNWRPVSKPRHWIRVTDPEPARSEAARLLQMKALLAQFHADADEDGNVSQLRLLPRQVHRYRRNQSGSARASRSHDGCRSGLANRLCANGCVAAENHFRRQDRVGSRTNPRMESATRILLALWPGSRRAGTGQVTTIRQSARRTTEISL